MRRPLILVIIIIWEILHLAIKYTQIVFKIENLVTHRIRFIDQPTDLTGYVPLGAEIPKDYWTKGLLEDLRTTECVNCDRSFNHQMPQCLI